MAFTYDVSTDLGKLRLAVGDTIATEILLQDDEHQTILDVHGLTWEAKLQALYLIRAKWMRDYDRSSIGLSASRSQRMQHINDVIAGMESNRNTAGKSFTFGTLQSEKTSERSNTDLIQPSFRRGQFDNAGSDDGDD